MRRDTRLSKLCVGITANADGPSWKCPTAYPLRTLETLGPGSAEGRMTAITACRTCGTEPLENARFCHGCGSPVKDGDTRAEYKQATVLFADVVHSMDIAAAVGAERLRVVGGLLLVRRRGVIPTGGVKAAAWPFRAARASTSSPTQQQADHYAHHKDDGQHQPGRRLDGDPQQMNFMASRVLHDEDHRQHDKDDGQPMPCRDPSGAAA
jgi:hypothetical protein